MFDFVANKKRVVQVVIGLLLLPFAFVGVDFYFRGMDASDQIAKVGDYAIGSAEFGSALRERQEQLREMMQGKVDIDFLNSPEIKNQVLEQLIEQKLLLASATEDRITVPDPYLGALLHEIPAFKDEAGKFSKERYEMLLRSRGMSVDGFEANLRRDVLLGQMRDAVTTGHWMPSTVVQRLAKIRAQQREVSQNVTTLQPYFATVSLEASEAKQYYDKSTSLYTLPERVRVEYITLSLESLTQAATVSNEDLEKYYQEHAAQFEKAEERRARHILIAADEKASAADKAKAKTKAEEVLGKARQSGADFAELAKSASQDPGSASEGGDLGFFGKGRMAKPFEDAVYAMKVGDISGPVETKFGYHIIKLEEIKAGERQTLEQVRSQIESEVKKALAGRQYAEMAEQFSSIVYEQSDSLKPAAEALKLPTEESSWITRDRAEPEKLGNEKFLKAVFADEVLKNKRNSEAIEIAPNTLVAARIIEHVPSSRQPFEVVSGLIEEQLKANKAAELAKKDGEARLARLRQGGEEPLQWSPGQWVSREKPEGLSPEAAQVVFQADVSKLPTYVTFTTPDQRFVIFRINRVQDGSLDEALKDKETVTQVTSAIARELHAARMKDLRNKSKVTINKDRLEKG